MNQMTSQSKQRLPSVKGTTEEFAGPEMNSGLEEKRSRGNFLFYSFVLTLSVQKRRRAFAGVRCPRSKSCKWRRAAGVINSQWQKITRAKKIAIKVTKLLQKKQTKLPLFQNFYKQTT